MFRIYKIIGKVNLKLKILKMILKELNIPQKVKKNYLFYWNCLLVKNISEMSDMEEMKLFDSWELWGKLLPFYLKWSFD